MSEPKENINSPWSKDSDSTFDALYVKYSPQVREFAFHLLKNETEAEDVTHDVFLRLWEQRQSIKDIVSMNGYLFRMTKNAVLNIFKRRNVDLRFRNERIYKKENTVELESQVTTDELLQLIELEISNMPEQRRKIFIMSRFENMSHAEIAEKLDISLKTVQYHISTALSELRKLLNVMLLFLG